MYLSLEQGTVSTRSFKVTRHIGVLLVAAAFALSANSAYSHHSFAMYDNDTIYNFTGVVTRVNPHPAHLVIQFVPLDEAREKIIRDEDGNPIQWMVELGGTATAAREGISVNTFPRGSIISVGLHPVRDGRGRAGAWHGSGLFKCPPDTPPAPGMHCDSVEGATAHGEGVMAESTAPAPLD